jgi:hypothetical protein
VGQNPSVLKPEAQTVRQQDDAWWIIHEEQRLFRFGRQEEAAYAAEIIRRYHFDMCVTLGRPAAVMTYFVRSR